MRQNPTISRPAPSAPKKFSHRLTQIFTDGERDKIPHLHPLPLGKERGWDEESFLLICVSSVFIRGKNVLNSQHHRLALRHDEDLFLDAVCARACDQSLWRLMKRFKAEAKSPVMHRNQSLGAKFEKGLHCFFRVHVNLATAGRFVGADGKQGDIDLVAVANFFESRKVCAVAAVKNRAAVHRYDKSAEVAMQVCEKPRAPVVTWRERNLKRPESHRLPVIKLVHNVETEIVHQVSYAHRHDNGLIGGDASQGTPVEMIEVRVGYQDEVNGRQMMNFEAWLFQSLDHLEPFRPDGVDQDIDFVSLNKKRGVPDPGDANLAFADFRKLRRRVTTGAFDEKRRDQDAGEKIALVPVGSRTQADARGALSPGASLRGLANDISPALPWKTNRHFRESI